MASAGHSVTVGSTDTVIFKSANDGGQCTEFMVGCQSGSASNLLVNVQGLHKPGEYFPIYKGAAVVFRLNYDGLGLVVVKGDGGNATIDFGVVSKQTAPN